MFKTIYEYEDFAQSTTNEDGSRVYVNASGVAYPSATTVLSVLSKDSIKEWRQRVGEEEANRISSKAAGRGTRVHTLCENYLNNQEDYLQKQMPDAIVMFKTLQPLLNEYVNNIHALEVPLYSDYLRTAGRVDCIAEFDGAISVIDFKTSSKPKEDKWIENYYMQCSAYAVMFEERTGIPVPRIVVMIAVDGDKAQIFVKKRNDYIDGFIKYRDIYEELLNVD